MLPTVCLRGLRAFATSAAICLAGVAVATETGSAPRELTEYPPAGDAITLINGSRLTGVQVLRVTALDYLVAIIDGVTMRIPVSQVAHVEYDDYEPGLHGGFGTGRNSSAAGAEIRAQEMASGLNAILTTPLEEGFRLPALDILDALAELRARFEIPIEAHPLLGEMPPEGRTWTVDIPEGGTLLHLFRDDFPSRFPGFIAVIEFDRVVLTRRVTAEGRHGPGPANPTATEKDTPASAEAAAGASENH